MDEYENEDMVLTNDMDPLCVQDLYQDHSWPSANGAMQKLKAIDGNPTGTALKLHSVVIHYINDHSFVFDITV